MDDIGTFTISMRVNQVRFNNDRTNKMRTRPRDVTIYRHVCITLRQAEELKEEFFKDNKGISQQECLCIFTFDPIHV